jgi:Protein of unknown function (DUF3891)
MIVRDSGDAWQVVLQTDHADLSGAFARAWADQGPRHASIVVAATRHDDGWAVWERFPLVERGSGRPLNFLDVQVPVHLTFYRAGIAAITDEDQYAGLLVSMHGAGIYRQRYGRDPGLKLTYADEVSDLVEEFVAEQEAAFERRAAEAGVNEDHRWADYELLQLYDRLSLYFCMRDVETGEAAELQGHRIEPAGAWRVRMAPFPFLESPARFRRLRRVMPKRPWALAEFREQFAANAPESVEITIERA